MEKKYKENWGKDVDYTILPKGITQEMLVTILERITETGESILIGYEKLKAKVNEDDLCLEKSMQRIRFRKKSMEDF